jgi:allantoinase
MVQVFVSNRVVLPEGVMPAAIAVEGGRITGVTSPDEVPESAVVHSFGDLVLMPGLVDIHVHVNEPGRSEWEGFETATRAAAAGGITTLVDMPLNCLPETTTVTALEIKRAAARGKCHVDWAAWGGLTDDNQEHLQSLARAGVRGYKCFLVDPGIEGLTRLSEIGLERAAPTLARIGLPLLVHAELPGPLEAAAATVAGADWRHYDTYLRSRPDEAEINAIRLVIRLCREHRFRVHIVHLATGLALQELDAARREGLPITVETCPHYLHFAAEDIPSSGTLLKCAPPIRSRGNREELWNGLRRGIIDLIATDHSPCPPAMKRLQDGDFRTAWGGIASLSLAASIIWTAMKAREIPLSELSRWMAGSPAVVSGLSERKGSLAVGMDADFAVFDPEASFRVTTETLHYRHPVSPYLGEQLVGVVRQTFLRGEKVYGEDGFNPSPKGAEVKLGDVGYGTQIYSDEALRS